jgi:hypothetical protein
VGQVRVRHLGAGGGQGHGEFVCVADPSHVVVRDGFGEDGVLVVLQALVDQAGVEWLDQVEADGSVIVTELETRRAAPGVGPLGQCRVPVRGERAGGQCGSRQLPSRWRKNRAAIADSRQERQPDGGRTPVECGPSGGEATPDHGQESGDRWRLLFQGEGV